MTYPDRARTGTRHSPSTLLAIVVVLSAALIGVATPPVELLARSSEAPLGPEPVVGETGRSRHGVTGLDEDAPTVANLDPDLLGSLRRATVAASVDGVRLSVTSGWRSVDHQERLLREAIADHGSEEAAARWVAPPERSAHVSGDAVDIGPAAAAAWLAEHGPAYGLCPIYSNEPWHFELRPESVHDGCPPRYADPTEDPRMQE